MTLAEEASGKLAPEATIAVLRAPAASGALESFPVVSLYWLAEAPARSMVPTYDDGGVAAICSEVSYWVWPKIGPVTEMFPPVVCPTPGPPQVKAGVAVISLMVFWLTASGPPTTYTVVIPSACRAAWVSLDSWAVGVRRRPVPR